MPKVGTTFEQAKLEIIALLQKLKEPSATRPNIEAIAPHLLPEEIERIKTCAAIYIAVPTINSAEETELLNWALNGAPTALQNQLLVLQICQILRPTQEFKLAELKSDWQTVNMHLSSLMNPYLQNILDPALQKLHDFFFSTTTPLNDPLLISMLNCIAKDATPGSKGDTIPSFAETLQRWQQKGHGFYTPENYTAIKRELDAIQAFATTLQSLTPHIEQLTTNQELIAVFKVLTEEPKERADSEFNGLVTRLTTTPNDKQTLKELRTWCETTKEIRENNHSKAVAFLKHFPDPKPALIKFIQELNQQRAHEVEQNIAQIPLYHSFLPKISQVSAQLALLKQSIMSCRDKNTIQALKAELEKLTQLLMVEITQLLSTVISALVSPIAENSLIKQCKEMYYNQVKTLTEVYELLLPEKYLELQIQEVTPHIRNPLTLPESIKSAEFSTKPNRVLMHLDNLVALSLGIPAQQVTIVSAKINSSATQITFETLALVIKGQVTSIPGTITYNIESNSCVCSTGLLYLLCHPEQDPTFPVRITENMLKIARAEHEKSMHQEIPPLAQMPSSSTTATQIPQTQLATKEQLKERYTKIYPLLPEELKASMFQLYFTSQQSDTPLPPSLYDNIIKKALIITIINNLMTLRKLIKDPDSINVELFKLTDGMHQLDTTFDYERAVTLLTAAINLQQRLIAEINAYIAATLGAQKLTMDIHLDLPKTKPAISPDVAAILSALVQFEQYQYIAKTLELLSPDIRQHITLDAHLLNPEAITKYTKMAEDVKKCYIVDEIKFKIDQLFRAQNMAIAIETRKAFSLWLTEIAAQKKQALPFVQFFLAQKIREIVQELTAQQIFIDESFAKLGDNLPNILKICIKYAKNLEMLQAALSIAQDHKLECGIIDSSLSSLLETNAKIEQQYAIRKIKTAVNKVLSTTKPDSLDSSTIEEFKKFKHERWQELTNLFDTLPSLQQQIMAVLLAQTMHTIGIKRTLDGIIGIETPKQQTSQVNKPIHMVACNMICASLFNAFNHDLLIANILATQADPITYSADHLCKYEC